MTAIMNGHTVVLRSESPPKTYLLMFKERINHDSFHENSKYYKAQGNRMNYLIESKKQIKKTAKMTWKTEVKTISRGYL